MQYDGVRTQYDAADFPDPRRDGHVNLRRVLAVLAMAGLAGAGVFLSLARLAVSGGKTTAHASDSTFAAVLSRFPQDDGPLEPDSLALIDGTGGGHHLAALHVLTYEAAAEREVRVDVPFWFVKLKGPAAALVLRRTGYDLREHKWTPEDLERRGPGILVHETRPNGNRILVWTDAH